MMEASVGEINQIEGAKLEVKSGAAVALFPDADEIRRRRVRIVELYFAADGDLSKLIDNLKYYPVVVGIIAKEHWDLIPDLCHGLESRGFLSKRIYCFDSNNPCHHMLPENLQAPLNFFAYYEERCGCKPPCEQYLEISIAPKRHSPDPSPQTSPCCAVA
jgi:hypothetical protein